MHCDPTSHRGENTENLVFFELLDIEGAGKVPNPQSRDDFVHSVHRHLYA